MKTIIKNKSILVAVAILVLMVFFYKFFFQSERISVPNELSASSIGDDLLKIYAQLQKVTLDQSTFSSAEYLDLTDFTTSILPETTGRANPFDLIGRD